MERSSVKVFVGSIVLGGALLNESCPPSFVSSFADKSNLIIFLGSKSCESIVNGDFLRQSLTEEVHFVNSISRVIVGDESLSSVLPLSEATESSEEPAVS